MITALIGLDVSFKVHRKFLPIALTLIVGGVVYLGGFLIVVAIGSDCRLRKKRNYCEDCKIDTIKNR